MITMNDNPESSMINFSLRGVDFCNPKWNVFWACLVACLDVLLPLVSGSSFSSYSNLLSCVRPCNMARKSNCVKSFIVSKFGEKCLPVKVTIFHIKSCHHTQQLFQIICAIFEKTQYWTACMCPFYDGATFDKQYTFILFQTLHQRLWANPFCNYCQTF